jgi:Carbamoyl-phosphate synthase small chain, CPSase domain
MTDPSYKGQFVCFTHVHIGNTGINFGERVSSDPHLLVSATSVPAGTGPAPCSRAVQAQLRKLPTLTWLRVYGCQTWLDRRTCTLQMTRSRSRRILAA